MQILIVTVIEGTMKIVMKITAMMKKEVDT